jgi:type I restriction enzyme S subunit
MPEVITENLDLWTSVLLTKSSAGRGSNGKQEAYGIRKLRELIYELASKGLLVDTSTDSYAKTVRIGDVAELVMGQAPPGNECNKEGIGTIFVKTGEFGGLYPDVVEWTTKPLKLAKAGDVLICVVGATVGKLNLAIDCAIGRSVAAIRPQGNIDTKYLYFSLMPYTLKLRNQSRGSAQGVIGKEELNSVEIRLPLLEEQYRIVAKIGELMALCDQLEQQQIDNIAAHQTLVETLLGTLTQAANAQAFAEAWNRIFEHFDTLFTIEHSVDQLKQTILQLGVMGKLVLQDPNDEPASELLKRIAAEKMHLTEEGKTRQKNVLMNIGEDETPYTLPNGWEWARLGQIIDISSGNGLTSANMNSSGEIPVYGGNGVTGYHDQTNVEKPTLVIGRVGYYCGSIHITPATAWVTDNAFVTTFSEENIYLDFLYWLLKGTNLKENENATAQPVISGRKIYPIVIGLPPKKEQIRIVAKVEELMTLCDALKARLADVQITQILLANAIVEQAVT